MSSKFSKMVKWLNHGRAEEGQAMVMVAFSLVVLLGFGAFAVDIGHVAVQKSDLQNAADAAALAGAAAFSNNTASQTAVTYAGLNGMKATTNNIMKDGDTVIVTTPYASDSTKIEVVCKRKVHYYFAGVLGFKATDVTARAVAQNMAWAGDALPFINLDGLGETSTIGQPLDAWNKVNPGDKERIHNDDLKITNSSIKVTYEDGFIDFKKGKDLSGIRTALENIAIEGRTVYIVSLKKEVMADYAKKGIKELKQDTPIPVTDTVLLECIITDGWSGTGSDKITLKYINSYKWDASEGTYLSTTGEKPGGSPKLVD